MNERLDAAYRDTTYAVGLSLPGSVGRLDLALRVGQPDVDLQTWLRCHGFACWALMTAWNPGSCSLEPQENRKRQEKLRQMLEDAGYSIFSGENQSNSVSWEPEPSFFVPGMLRAEALKMAAFWGQNAILWGELDGVPQLLWI